MNALVEKVAAAMMGHGPAVPLGLRYRQLEDLWDILIYPLPVEMVGGAHDGGLAAPGFSLDLEKLRSAFKRLTALGWDAHGTGAENAEDGPYIGVEGDVAGHKVWLRILAFAPADEAAAMKVDANSPRQAG
jgi:hypothetical protein